uniref:C2H2 type zinc finger domain-containing protein n=1 Tax=Ganoderma boninense TaxID=34458 RepID=A0A5K1JWN3_9APHY|nr:C2H2 type zinc finger domain-containing protein [Ganoderma boninense]
MQPPFTDPSLWAPPSSFATATAFSDPAAFDPGASLDLFGGLPDQADPLLDRLFKELIKDQECASPAELNTTGPVEGIDFGLGLDFNFSQDINISSLDSFRLLDHRHALETEMNPQVPTGNWSPVFATLQLRTPSSSCQDSLSSSPASMSVPSRPSSSASSPASLSSSSSSPTRSRSPYSPYPAGKRSVTQPSRNAQISTSEHTVPKPPQANECRYCRSRFGRPADVARHEKTHFIGDYQYACLGVPVEEAGECDDADIANGFMHDGKLMVHGCLTTFKDRRDSYRRHLTTRGCPGSKAGYWANVKEVAAARAKRKANGY